MNLSMRFCSFLVLEWFFFFVFLVIVGNGSGDIEGVRKLSWNDSSWVFFRELISGWVLSFLIEEVLVVKGVLIEVSGERDKSSSIWEDFKCF